MSGTKTSRLVKRANTFIGSLYFSLHSSLSTLSHRTYRWRTTSSWVIPSCNRSCL